MALKECRAQGVQLDKKVVLREWGGGRGRACLRDGGPVGGFIIIIIIIIMIFCSDPSFNQYTLAFEKSS